MTQLALLDIPTPAAEEYTSARDALLDVEVLHATLDNECMGVLASVYDSKWTGYDLRNQAGVVCDQLGELVKAVGALRRALERQAAADEAARAMVEVRT